MPKRSASPSVASPTAAFFASTASRKGRRFSSETSGPEPSKSTSRSVRRACTSTPCVGERAIQVSGAASVQRVGHDAQFRSRAMRLEIHELRQALEIGVARIDFLKWFVVRFGGSAFAEFGGARFDVARHFGKRRAAIGPGKFQALIFGRIVAGGEIDGAVDLAPQDFVGDRGRRGRAIAQQHVDAVLAKNFRGRAREFLGEKSRVVADDQRRLRVAAAHVPRDGRRGQANVREGKIFRDDRAPARSSKFDRRRHFVNKMFPPPAKYCSVACKRAGIREMRAKRERVTGPGGFA